MRDRLQVVKIDRFGEESASVSLTSGQAQVTVFCWPCELAEGEQVPNSLASGLDHDLAVACLADWPSELKAERSRARLEREGGESPWAWRGCGQLVDAAHGIVDVLGFKIEFGAVDLPEGEAVEFACERLQLQGSR